MPFIRSLPTAHALLRRSSARAARRTSLYPVYRRGYAHSGYGDGEGSPTAEQPQKQGPSPSSDLEHPGPPPVSEGQGSGSSPTKGTSEGHNTGSASTSGSGSGSTGGSGSDKPQPKIHADNLKSSSGKEDVEQHNREFEKRHDRATPGAGGDDNKVGKGFWQGHGGADREP